MNFLFTKNDGSGLLRQRIAATKVFVVGADFFLLTDFMSNLAVVVSKKITDFMSNFQNYDMKSVNKKKLFTH